MASPQGPDSGGLLARRPAGEEDAPAEQRSWIDLHTHILPGVDDGARDLAQSIRMARIAEQGGISHLVATPHSLDWPAEDQQPAVDAAVGRLNAALQAAGVPVTILPGVEVAIVPEISAQVRSGQVFGLAHSRYVLLELPATAYPLYTEQTVFELQLSGMAVILAHPERNARIEERPDLVLPLVERGVLLQVTAGSIVGQFGPRVQKTARNMLQRGMVHLIASDAHDDTHRRPVLAEAVRAAGEIVGPEQAHAMVCERPWAIVQNAEFEVQPPHAATPARRAFWSWRRPARQASPPRR